MQKVVVPANAGTHSPPAFILRKASATVPYRQITRYGSRRKAGTTRAR